MEVTGSTHDEYARKYPEFCYRTQIIRPLTPFSIDPDRLNFMNEYPRYTGIGEQNLETKDLADFRLVIGTPDDKHNGLSPVRVWLRPNKYTLAKAERLVVEFYAAFAHLHLDALKQTALAMAFRSP